MMLEKNKQQQLLAEISAQENGRRQLTGATAKLFMVLAISWSLFQLWISSPLPFIVHFGIFNDTATRSIHLTFGVILAYLAFPMSKRSANHLPVYDIIFAVAAGVAASYLYLFSDSLNTRPGAPILQDLIIALVGVVTLLEATRRVMGMPMTLLAMVFLAYVFLGPYMPELISHKGASLSRAASQMWLTSEGVFGVALGVSTSFVFVYVLFGAMLEKAGAGNYLTRLSFALLGHMRGGPAKAAVVASGLHGLISGSSTANVLTCGPVTIPLMKKVGFSAEKAGGIEVAAGSNGQIMPPVMGAAAFLMIEYINMPYSQLIKHAFIPAILAYVSLLFIVHIESCKMGLKGLPRQSTAKERLVGYAIALCVFIILSGVVRFLMGWMPNALGAMAVPTTIVLLLGAYLACLYLSVYFPEIVADQHEDFHQLPAVKPTLLGGFYYLLPLLTLIICLVVYEMSPGLAAFYGCMFMTFILLTQRPLVAVLRKRSLKNTFYQGANEWVESLVNGARNMIGIALATATAGIIVGAVSLTGVGQVLAEVVEVLSMGSLILVLVLTAFLSLILGMGLPTTANYIVVSTLLVPVISSLSTAHGLDIPLVAIHLFVFYFGIMADATPPVALAAFAAAGIAHGDPLKTGIQGFIYEIRTAILPFVFIFNTELLLLGDSNGLQMGLIIFGATVACFAFAAFMQRFWLVKLKKSEMLALVIAMIFLFRPGFILDQVFPKDQAISAPEIKGLTHQLTEDHTRQLKLTFLVDDGYQEKKRVFAFPVSREQPIGLEFAQNGDHYVVDDIAFGGLAAQKGMDSANDYRLLDARISLPQPHKVWFIFPGLIIVLLVGLWQYSRYRRSTMGQSGGVILQTA